MNVRMHADMHACMPVCMTCTQLCMLLCMTVRVCVRVQQWCSAPPNPAQSGALASLMSYGSSDDVFLTERFYMGGANLRGFDFRRAGPTQFQRPIGGEVIYTSTYEVFFPLIAFGSTTWWSQ